MPAPLPCAPRQGRRASMCAPRVRPGPAARLRTLLSCRGAAVAGPRLHLCPALDARCSMPEWRCPACRPPSAEYTPMVGGGWRWLGAACTAWHGLQPRSPRQRRGTAAPCWLGGRRRRTGRQPGCLRCGIPAGVDAAAAGARALPRPRRRSRPAAATGGYRRCTATTSGPPSTAATRSLCLTACGRCWAGSQAPSTGPAWTGMPCERGGRCIGGAGRGRVAAGRQLSSGRASGSTRPAR